MTKTSLAQFGTHCFQHHSMLKKMNCDFIVGKDALHFPVRETLGFKSIGNVYLNRHASQQCPSLESILVEADAICFIWLYFPCKLLPKHNIWQLLPKTRGLISLDFSGSWLKAQAEFVRIPVC